MIEDKMKPPRPSHRDWAVFRYGLISEATRPLTDEVASQVLARVAARQPPRRDTSQLSGNTVRRIDGCQATHLTVLLNVPLEVSQ